MVIGKIAKLYAYAKAPAATFMTLHPLRTAKLLMKGIVALPLGIWLGRKMREERQPARVGTGTGHAAAPRPSSTEPTSAARASAPAPGVAAEGITADTVTAA